MGGGFRALLKSLLSNLGLIFLDPLDPAIRKISVPIVQEALVAAPELKAKLLGANQIGSRRVSRAGPDRRENVAIFSAGKWRAGSAAPQGFRVRRLRDRAAEVSPNALLRPVVAGLSAADCRLCGGPPNSPIWRNRR